MTVYIEDEVKASFEFDYKMYAELVIDKALSQEHFPYDIELSITFTDEEAIKTINNEYRDIDSSTDVLSFPMIDYDNSFAKCSERTEDMYSFIENNVDVINPDTDEVILGDIVLCIPMLYKQAEEYNHSVLREYAFLIAHSMLHLLGYDHIEDDERLIMEEKQDLILKSLDITRDF